MERSSSTISSLPPLPPSTFTISLPTLPFLPVEIYKKIFSYVCDSKTYKNIREANRFFRDILPHGKIFNNKKLSKIFVFDDPNNIKILNCYNIEIGHIKIVYPCTIHYLIKDDKTTTLEYFYRPTYITKLTTLESNNTKIQSYDKYNIHTKKNEQYSVSNYVSFPHMNGCLIN